MPTTFDLMGAARRFIDDVHARAETDVDPPGQDRDWEDLAFGYLLGQGADPTSLDVRQAARYMAWGRLPGERPACYRTATEPR